MSGTGGWGKQKAGTVWGGLGFRGVSQKVDGLEFIMRSTKTLLSEDHGGPWPCARHPIRRKLVTGQQGC